MYNGPASETPIATLRDHLEVNSIAPLILFQAFVPALKASSNPKYIPISTGGASSAYIAMPMGQACYGGSKVLMNFITRKIHYETEWLSKSKHVLDHCLTCPDICFILFLAAFPLAPGCIDTDMCTTCSNVTGHDLLLIEAV